MGGFLSSAGSKVSRGANVTMSGTKQQLQDPKKLITGDPVKNTLNSWDVGTGGLTKPWTNSFFKKAEDKAAAAEAAAEEAKNQRQAQWDSFMGELNKGPQFNSLIDANTGLLKDQYKMKGGSAWQDMQLAQQKVQQQQAIDDAMRASAASNAGAYNQLAMRGGLSSGARERIAAGSAQGANANRQNIFRQGELKRLGINTEAEGMNRQADAFNIKSALDEQNAQRANEQLKYSERMKALASGNTADAQNKSGGSGGWLGQLGKYFS